MTERLTFYGILLLYRINPSPWQRFRYTYTPVPQINNKNHIALNSFAQYVVFTVFINCHYLVSYSRLMDAALPKTVNLQRVAMATANNQDGHQQ